jgi:hypothetical protein
MIWERKADLVTRLNIAQQRLQNQQILSPTFQEPEEVVRWLGAIQAQDYLGSLWALGLRMGHAGEKEIERAIADKKIVRSWPLRGTLHFAAAEDVRWMLGLIAPRTIASSASRYRQLGLGEDTFAKSGEVIAHALQAGKQLTRHELAAALHQAGISTEGQRLIHILSRSALDGQICYAARRGKEFTFALLDEWVPAARTLNRDEALAELARRYFTSHGPATLQDFGWWSGLAAADARASLEMVKSELSQAVFDGQAYWFPRHTSISQDAPATAYLLPGFDEYLVAYKDRHAVLDPKYARRLNALISPIIVISGRVLGTWKRTLKKSAVVIETQPFTSFDEDERDAIASAAQRYGEFLGMTVEFV